MLIAMVVSKGHVFLILYSWNFNEIYCIVQTVFRCCIRYWHNQQSVWKASISSRSPLQRKYFILNKEGPFKTCIFIMFIVFADFKAPKKADVLGGSDIAVFAGT